MVRRRGNGRMRHVRVGTMWIQEKEESGEVQYNKVEGEENTADLMTNARCEKKMRRHNAGVTCHTLPL